MLEWPLPPSGAFLPAQAGRPAFGRAEPLRFGVLGCANIAKKNCRALRLSKNARLVAVASRSAARAEAWVREFSCEEPAAVRVHEGYDALLEDPNVEAVYVPLPTTLHLEWVKKAFKAGLHVIVEKPVALTAGDLCEMVLAARESGRLLYDGTMFMHNPRLGAVLSKVYDPAGFFGRPSYMCSAFSFCGDAAFRRDNIRVRPDGDPLGALGDLGHYCIRMAIMVAGAVPRRAKGVYAARNEAGVIVECSAALCFDGACGQVLEFSCSFRRPFRQRFEVCGADRTLRLDDFVLNRDDGAAFTVVKEGLDDHAVTPTQETRTYAVADVCQEANMFDNFAADAEAVRAGADRGAFWQLIMLATQATTDAVATSLEDGAAGWVDVERPPLFDELLAEAGRG